MSEFDEDRANSQVNEDLLESEFGIDTTEERQSEIQEISNMRQQMLDVIRDTGPDPDVILLTNIERANSLLDIAQNSIARGGETNARLFEVCAQLINAITSAAASVQTSSFGMMKHEYNMKMVAVKEKEVAVKAAIAQDKVGGRSGGDGKVVIMSREDLLKMMEKEEVDVQVDSTNED